MNPNYKNFRARISKANSDTELKKLEKSLTNLYGNGIFNANELMKLDGFIMDKIANL